MSYRPIDPEDRPPADELAEIHRDLRRYSERAEREGMPSAPVRREDFLSTRKVNTNA